MKEPVFIPGGLLVLLMIVGFAMVPIFGPDVYRALFSVIGHGATVLVIAVWLFFARYAWTEETTMDTKEMLIGVRQRWRRFFRSGQQILPPEKEPAPPPYERRLAGREKDSNPE